MAQTDANNNSPTMNGKANEKDFMDIMASLPEDKLFRGSTPKDIEEKCLNLCQAYLQGSWALAGVEDITVSRITGGLTNQLYKVQLNDSAARSESPLYADEPSVVAIKLYEAKHMANYQEGDEERLNDNLILTIMSQTGMGPKVYGIFNDGFIQSFHEHEQFAVKHQKNPKLLREVATLMARVHALNVPIRKTTRYWFATEITKFLELGYKVNNVEKLIEELDLPTLKKHDIRQEMRKLEKLYESFTSTQVFCHSDFRCMNILITKPEEKILLVDLEYSAYCCRAYDIATFIMEWGQERFDFRNMGIPEDSVIEHFVQLYIEECEKLNPGYSKKPVNAPSVIVRETKILILTQYLFFASFFIKQQEAWLPAVPFDPTENMKQVENCYAKYHEMKQQLIDDGTIQE